MHTGITWRSLKNTDAWFWAPLDFSFQRRQWHPTPVLLPGKSHGWRSLVGYSPWGRWESDTTERLHFHFSLSCIGEGNGNPLQCSCLENPRDKGAWWAAIYGVAQSQTWLKQLSSSSSSSSSYARWLASIAIYLCFVNIKELQSWIWNSALTHQILSQNEIIDCWFRAKKSIRLTSIPDLK